MKVIVPLDEDRVNVCPVLGRTPLFLVRDLDSGMDEVVENPGAQAESGAGLKAAQAVVDSGADVLITPRCGENAAQVFQAAEIRIYQSRKGTAGENIEAFRAGELEKLTHFHSGYHGIR